MNDEMLGMRHAALYVRDMTETRRFYEELVGLSVIWAPDPDNIYLTSGRDNIALHTAPEGHVFEGGNLDHIGFLFRSTAGVDAVYQTLTEANVTIHHERKRHRDDSYSFYAHDPDGVLVQFLYEPNVAAAEGSQATD